MWYIVITCMSSHSQNVKILWLQVKFSGKMRNLIITWLVWENSIINKLYRLKQFFRSYRWKLFLFRQINVKKCGYWQNQKKSKKQHSQKMLLEALLVVWNIPTNFKLIKDFLSWKRDYINGVSNLWLKVEFDTMRKTYM